MKGKIRFIGVVAIGILAGAVITNKVIKAKKNITI